MQIKKIAALLGLVTSASIVSAASYTLDFSGNICGVNGSGECGDASEISTAYGDVAGVIDVSYRAYYTADGSVYESFLKFWGAGYSNLQGVAWGGPNAFQTISEITFTPAAGRTVTLESFQFGDYAERDAGSSARIVDAGSQQVLWSSGGFDPAGNAPASFAPAVSSAVGLVLSWGPDGYDVAIDNIQLSVSAVPEAASPALMLAGLALIGATLRRRRR